MGWLPVHAVCRPPLRCQARVWLQNDEGTTDAEPNGQPSQTELHPPPPQNPKTRKIDTTVLDTYFWFLPKVRHLPAAGSAPAPLASFR